MKGHIHSIQFLVRGGIISLFLMGALVGGNASAQTLCMLGPNVRINPHEIVNTCPTFIFTNLFITGCGHCAQAHVVCTEVVYSHGAQQYCGPFDQCVAVGGTREDGTICAPPETAHHQACYDRNDGWRMPIATDRNGDCRAARDTQSDAVICETIDPDSEGDLEPGYFRDTLGGSCVPVLSCSGSAPFKQHPSIALSGPDAGNCTSQMDCENRLSGFANAVTGLCETPAECPGENQERLANNTCDCADEPEKIGDSTTLICVRLCESGHERIDGACVIATLLHQTCYLESWRMPIAADIDGNCRATEDTETDRVICSRITAVPNPFGQPAPDFEAGYFSDTFGGACAIGRGVTCSGTVPFRLHPSASLTSLNIGRCITEAACENNGAFANTVNGVCEAPTVCRDDQERQPNNTCACPDEEEELNNACVFSGNPIRNTVAMCITCGTTEVPNEDRTNPPATLEEHNKAPSHLLLLPVCCWATGLATGLTLRQ